MNAGYLLMQRIFELFIVNFSISFLRPRFNGAFAIKQSILVWILHSFLTQCCPITYQKPHLVRYSCYIIP